MKRISNRTVRPLSACAIAVGAIIVGAFTVLAGPASASGGTRSG